MYLHPLIHSELTRQHERQLSRILLRGGRGLRSLPGKQAAAALGALLIATVAALALTSGALASSATRSPPPATTPRQPPRTAPAATAQATGPASPTARASSPCPRS
jgi:hypothetical protein